MSDTKYHRHFLELDPQCARHFTEKFCFILLSGLNDHYFNGTYFQELLALSTYIWFYQVSSASPFLEQIRAQNISFQSLYGGQFTLSTRLIKPNFRRSTIFHRLKRSRSRDSSVRWICHYADLP